MTGAEHYEQAEAAIRATAGRRKADDPDFGYWSRAEMLAFGQIHATLALVAAVTLWHPPQRYVVGDLGIDDAEANQPGGQE